MVPRGLPRSKWDLEGHRSKASHALVYTVGLSRCCKKDAQKQRNQRKRGPTSPHPAMRLHHTRVGSAIRRPEAGPLEKVSQLRTRAQAEHLEVKRVQGRL